MKQIYSLVHENHWPLAENSETHNPFDLVLNFWFASLFPPFCAFLCTFWHVSTNKDNTRATLGGKWVEGRSWREGMGMELINTYYVHVWILNKTIRNRKITVTIFYHLRKISQSSTQKPSEEFIYVNPYQYISVHIHMLTIKSKISHQTQILFVCELNLHVFQSILEVINIYWLS